MSRQLSTLLLAFEQGHISEQALSYMLALHAVDAAENKEKLRRVFTITVNLKFSGKIEVFVFRTRFFAVKAALLAQDSDVIRSVIIRANFLEDDNGSAFMREWWSSNNELYTEKRWYSSGKFTQTLIDVLELPSIPNK